MKAADAKPVDPPTTVDSKKLVDPKAPVDPKALPVKKP
jgi:hypothetical protein